MDSSNDAKCVTLLHLLSNGSSDVGKRVSKNEHRKVLRSEFSTFRTTFYRWNEIDKVDFAISLCVKSNTGIEQALHVTPSRGCFGRQVLLVIVAQS